VKKEDIFKDCFEQFSSLIESTRESNKVFYEEFSKNIIEKKHEHIY